jgi:hypothetical protein
VKRCYSLQRARYRRRKLIKIKKLEKQQQQQNRINTLNKKQAANNECYVKNEDDQEKNNIKKESFISSSITSASNMNTNEFDASFFDNPDMFLPSRREFFLYTINEHQILTNKTLTAKKKIANNPNYVQNVKKMSKSDPNLELL